MATSKNYAKREGPLTICTCEGKPPEDVACEFCDEMKGRLCFYYVEQIEHCGNMDAQKEAK